MTPARPPVYRVVLEAEGAFLTEDQAPGPGDEVLLETTDKREAEFELGRACASGDRP